MTTLATDRNTPQRDAVDFEFPMAATTRLFAGGIACVNSSGYLTKGAASTTLKTVGITVAGVNNTGSAGAVNGKVRRGCFRFANSASTDLITLADVGASCYVVDDQTVAKTNGSSTRSVAGTIRDVDASGVWAEI